MQTTSANFVVTDTETTGGSAARDRIIEIGAVKVQGDKVVDRFEQLINPERAISRKITRITGISTAMVFDQPTIGEVLPDYMEFLGDGVLVAHNAPFDVRFLNAELKRNGFDNLDHTALCTLRLARRLLPGLRSKGLSSLIDFYQLRSVNRHRALGDAGATGEILRRFLSQLRFEHGVETVSELLRFQRKRYRDVRKVPSHIRKVREDVLPHVPASPGVYTMRASNGKPIYIGKARNLKSRVRSYFTSMESHDAHRQNLVRRVRNVTWEEVPSELDALFMESHLIKEHRPKYNRAQRSYWRRPFLKIATNRPYPAVELTYKLDDPQADYYGPFSGKKQASWLIEVINQYFALRECADDRLEKGHRCYLADIERCTAPCENSGVESAYANALVKVKRFLSGDGEEVQSVIDTAMRKAAKEMHFERAAELRDEKKRVERFTRRQNCSGGSALRRNEVVVLKKSSLRQVFFIRKGQHQETVNLDGDVARGRARLASALRRHYASTGDEMPELSMRDIHEMRLLAQWMYRRRDDLVKVPITGEGLERVADQIMEVLEGKVGEVA